MGRLHVSFAACGGTVLSKRFLSNGDRRRACARSACPDAARPGRHERRHKGFCPAQAGTKRHEIGPASRKASGCSAGPNAGPKTGPGCGASCSDGTKPASGHTGQPPCGAGPGHGSGYGVGARSGFKRDGGSSGAAQSEFVNAKGCPAGMAPRHADPARGASGTSPERWRRHRQSTAATFSERGLSGQFQRPAQMETDSVQGQGRD